MGSERRPPAGNRRRRQRRRDRDRAVSPVVGKAVEASVVVLYVAVLSATLYGGVVPEYRSAAGAEVGERVLAQSAERVQQAVPTDARTVRVRVRVSLPDTIRGRGYAVRTDGRTLVLDHPRDGVGGRARLAIPPTVASVAGNWTSGDPAFVVVRDSAGESGLAVRLESGDGTGEAGEVGGADSPEEGDG